MKPSRSPLRTVLLLALACWVIFSAAWLTWRWMAISVLNSSGLRYTCEKPTWLKSTGEWTKLVPGTRIVYVRLDSSLENGEGVAWAIRSWNAPESMMLDGLIAAPPFKSECQEVMICLRKLGRQPAVTKLIVRSVAMSDEQAAQLLAQFPGLEDLHLTQNGYSGANLPAFPSLQSVLLDREPFADEGLATLLRSPLRVLCIREPGVEVPHAAKNP